MKLVWQTTVNGNVVLKEIMPWDFWGTDDDPTNKPWRCGLCDFVAKNVTERKLHRMVARGIYPEEFYTRPGILLTHLPKRMIRSKTDSPGDPGEDNKS